MAVRASSSSVGSFTTSTRPARSRSTPQCPWEVYSHRQTSAISRRLGAAFFSARTACCTMPSWAQAPEPSGSFAAGMPNRSTAGTPAASMRWASSARRSTERWNWPGSDAISLRTPAPGTTNNGWTSDSRQRRCSRTMARSAGNWRRRRERWMGNMDGSSLPRRGAGRGDTGPAAGGPPSQIPRQLKLRDREAVGEQAAGGIAVGEGAFELGILDGFEHGAELRAGAVAPGDEIFTADELGRAQGFGRRLGAHALGEFPQAEVAVAHGAVEAQELEAGFDIGLAQEALAGALAHARQVDPLHMVGDQGDHRGGVLRGEAKAVADLFGDAGADGGVAIEADAVGGAAEGWRLAHIMKEDAEGQGRRDRMRQGVDHHQGVDPDVALGVVLGRLLDPLHARDFGQDRIEQAG